MVWLRRMRWPMILLWAALPLLLEWPLCGHRSGIAPHAHRTPITRLTIRSTADHPASDCAENDLVSRQVRDFDRAGTVGGYHSRHPVNSNDTLTTHCFLCAAFSWGLFGVYVVASHENSEEASQTVLRIEESGNLQRLLVGSHSPRGPPRHS